MSEHGFPLAFKRKVIAVTDVVVALAVVWWIVRYAYAHDWPNLLLWCAAGVFHAAFSVWQYRDMKSDAG